MMAQVIKQATTEAMKAAVRQWQGQQVTREKNAVVATPSRTARSCGLTKQWTFKWEAQDKHDELLNLEMEIKNIFISKSYDIHDSERVPITMSWLGHKGLHIVQILREDE